MIIVEIPIIFDYSNHAQWKIHELGKPITSMKSMKYRWSLIIIKSVSLGAVKFGAVLNMQKK